MGDRRRSMIPASVAGVIVALCLLTVVLWSRTLHDVDDVVASYGAAGLMWTIVLGGVGVLVLRDSPGNLLGPLLAGVLYAGYMLTMQRARGALASWPTLALSTASGVLPLLLLALALGEQVMPQEWTPVVALAISSQIIGQGLLVYALPHFSALVIGLTLLVQPAIAALLGWMVYGEKLTPIDIVGGVLLAAALVLVRLPQRAGA